MTVLQAGKGIFPACAVKSEQKGHRMSRADRLYIETCRRILTDGVSDEGLSVRPRWQDGTPAHTKRLFGVVNRYDLREEFPIIF